MSLVLADRVQETTASTGTGTIHLAGAVTACQSFISAIGNGNSTYYTILSGDGTNWEVGEGTVTSGSPNTLSRTTVLSSSNSGSHISLNGTSTVWGDAPAALLSILAGGTTGSGEVVLATSPTLTGTVTLPDGGTLTASSATFSAEITASGNINSNTYYAASRVILAATGNYNDMYDGAGNAAVLLGYTGDPSNYYRNTTHSFQSIGGSTAFCSITSTEMASSTHINLGDASNYFGTAFLATTNLLPVSAPSSPSSGWDIYTDTRRSRRSAFRFSCRSWPPKYAPSISTVPDSSPAACTSAAIASRNLWLKTNAVI